MPGVDEVFAEDFLPNNNDPEFGSEVANEEDALNAAIRSLTLPPNSVAAARSFCIMRRD